MGYLFVLYLMVYVHIVYKNQLVGVTAFATAVGWYMCTSNFIGSVWPCCCIILILFLEFECERDLENLESLGLEGGLYEFVYFVNLLSLE